MLRKALMVGILCSAGCKEDRKTLNLQKPTTTPVEIRNPLPAGIQAQILLDHFTDATIADLTPLVPESSFTGARVEGNTFDKPGELYIFKLQLQNSSPHEITVPQLRVHRANPQEGADEVIFPRGHEKVPAGAKKWFFYLWDPGAVPVEGKTTARLVWTP